MVFFANNTSVLNLNYLNRIKRYLRFRRNNEFILKFLLKIFFKDFLYGPTVKNLSFNAGEGSRYLVAKL